MRSLTLKERFYNLNYRYIGLICLIAMIGFFMLYDAANGNFMPWALPQFLRFCIGFVLMIAVALTPLHFWLRNAYYFYGVALLLIMLVLVFGHVGMGAQRWLDLYIIKLQPSEIMRISLVLALACYFHRITLEEARTPSFLIVPFFMITFPVLLVIKQPDLGTALLLLGIGVSLFWAAGVKQRYFILGFGSLCILAPLAWKFVLHDYQKKRVLIFLDPESDPLKAGYHITQSKIALGSGEIFGKGFMKGTQSHLNFLPEKQTDFIFTMYAEEFGLVGALFLLALYATLIFMGFLMATRIHSKFGRLMAFGVTMTMAIYVAINTAMVMGLVPVVGVPLPMVSYGGTAMITLMIGFGLLLSADVHRDQRLSRY